MTRDEIRRAFRQAQQEEFAAVPQQPSIDASPKFQRKMERLLHRAPRRQISKKQRIVGILLAAVLLVLGGCTVYQIAFTNGAYIKYTGAYTDLRYQPTGIPLSGSRISREARLCAPLSTSGSPGLYPSL